MTNSTEKLSDFRASKISLAYALAERERRRTLDPLKYADQHPKQKEASEALRNHNLLALFWGNRVGKTEWGAQTVAEVVQGRHAAIKSPCEIWSFCPSFDEQKDTTQKKLLSYIPEHLIVDRSWLRKGILKELVVKSEAGIISKITFKSYEQGREKAQGAGKALIWFDEEPPKDIFEECFVRQEAGVTLKIIMTMTPIKGMTWVYNDIYLNTANPDYWISQATWQDNPWLTEDQKAVMRRGLSPQALKVREQGQFMRMVGLVCPWWDRSVHLIDMPTLPEGWDFQGIDFGFSNPACCLWVRIDHDGNLWVYDGFYRRKLTTPAIAKLIKDREKGHKTKGVRRVGDGAQASDIAELAQHGLKMVAVKKQPGTNKENWDEYRARIMQEYGEVNPETQKPKIYVSNTLTELDEDTGEPINFFVREIENLRWEEVKRNGEIETKPTWGKQPNHAIDTISYIISEMYQPAGMPEENTSPERHNKEATVTGDLIDKIF
jgi:phage terminase large subunit-like protein